MNPEYFDPLNAGNSDSRPHNDLVRLEGERLHRQLAIPESVTDTVRTALFVIDMQRDFTQSEGGLFVAGRGGFDAVEDCVRLSEFVYREATSITDTFVSLDSHNDHAIFFSEFWELSDGMPVEPNTMVVISREGQLVNVLPDGTEIGMCRPKRSLAATVTGGKNHVWLLDYCHHYCRELQRDGKYALYLWPPHGLIGHWGHTLNPVVNEALRFHAVARRSPTVRVLKGQEYLTESYSALGSEVMLAHDGTCVGANNSELVRRLATYDRVIIAGEAASHCVAATVDDIISHRPPHRSDMAGVEMYVLRDCMSAVVISDGPDFTPHAEALFERCEDAGIHVVESTTSMEEWPA